MNAMIQRSVYSNSVVYLNAIQINYFNKSLSVLYKIYVLDSCQMKCSSGCLFVI